MARSDEFVRRFLKSIEYRRKRIYNILVIAFLGCLTYLFFWEIIAKQGFQYADFALSMYPFRSFIANSYAEGQFPLWNPYVFSGYPFVGDIASAVLYPLNIILALLVKEGALAFKYVERQAIFHIFLAGVFMYYLMRHFALDRCAACISAFVFMFSGFLIGHMGHLGMLNGAVWLPLILLFLDKSFKERKIVWSACSGIFFAFSISAGHPQTPLLILFLIGIYTIYNIFLVYSDQKKFYDCGKIVGLFVVVVVIGFALNSAQIFPIREFYAQAHLNRISYAASTTFSLPPKNIITFFIPFFFGNQRPNSDFAYWGEWNYTELVGYVGILPILLALFAIIFKRNRATWFFSGLAALSLLLAFGGFTFLHTLNWLITPGFNQVRCPSRFVYLFDFSIAFLAGFGAQYLFSKLDFGLKEKLTRYVKILVRFFWSILGFTGLLYFGLIISVSHSKTHGLFAKVLDNLILFDVIVFLSLVLLLWRLREKKDLNIIKAFAMVIILVDLFTFGWRYNSGPDPRPDYQEGGLVKFLKKDQSIFRVANDGVLPPNFSMIHKIQSISGYVGQISDRYSKATGMLDYTGPLPPIEHQMLNLLNVKYIITKKSLSSNRFKQVYAEGNRRIYENRELLPRAFSINKLIALENEHDLHKYIRGHQFNPLEALALEKNELEKLIKIEGLEVKPNVEPKKDGILELILDDRFLSSFPDEKEKKRYVNNGSFEIGSLQGWDVFPAGSEAKFWRARQKTQKLSIDGQYVLFFKSDPETKPGQYYVWQNLGEEGGKKLKPNRQYALTFASADNFTSQSDYAVRIRCIRGDGSHEDIVNLEDGFERGGRFSSQRIEFKTPAVFKRIILYLGVKVGRQSKGSVVKFDDIVIKEIQPKIESEIVFIDYQANTIKMSINMISSGMVVFSDLYYPGWKAYFDGRQKKIYRVNYLFRSLYIPKGRHDLEFIYKPDSFNYGLIITALTLFFIIGILFRERKIRKPPQTDRDLEE